VGMLHSSRESQNHQRLYDARGRARLKLILRGKRFGYSLGEIKEMIDLYDIDPTQKEQLKKTITMGHKKVAELDEMISELQQLKSEIEEFAQSFARILESLEKNEKGEENNV
jgi:DNA-binding transcriptional MerR regulator